MRKLFVIPLIFLITPVFGYQWPSNKDKIKYVFGTEIGEAFLDGVEFFNSDQGVYPMADGEVLFYEENLRFGDTKYSEDEGNILYIKHKGNFSGIYRNFKINNDSNLVKNINQGDLLGTANMGDSPFTFSLYDEIKNEFINPQQVLPRVEDDQKPVIGDVKLVAGGVEYKLTRNRSISAGYYSLYIDTYDVMKIAKVYRKITPFQIYVFVDGFENFNVSFSSIKEINEKMYVSGDQDILLDDIKDNKGFYYGGEIYLTTGKSLIEIVIKDIDGNESSRSIPIKIGEI